MKNGPYELIVAPAEYPGKKYRNKYAYEHHVVYWIAHGVLVKPGEVIHHVNGKKRDNHITNLILEKNTDHARHHMSMNRWEGTCSLCKKAIFLRWSQYRFLRRRKREYIYCSRICAGKHIYIRRNKTI